MRPTRIASWTSRRRKGRTSHFENLHGRKDAAAFGKELFDLATHNFGYPIRVFLARLTSALARDRAGLAAVVAKNVAKYEAAAAANSVAEA